MKLSPTATAFAVMAPENPKVPAVLADDRTGMRTALEYLTGLGHRRIAFLARYGDRRRVRTFLDTLAALGVPADENLVAYARASRDSAYAAAAGLLQHRPDLTAMLAGGNLLGEAAVLAARELDLRPALREEWLLHAPAFPLCREDCKGLCPQCGNDRNLAADEGGCACQPAADPRWAALQGAARDAAP